MSALDECVKHMEIEHRYHDLYPDIYKVGTQARAELTALRDKIDAMKHYADVDRERIVALHARIAECEKALIGMVEQYCRLENSNTYSNDFRSGGENAFEYLVKNGLAKWDNETGVDIILEEAKP